MRRLAASLALFACDPGPAPAPAPAPAPPAAPTPPAEPPAPTLAPADRTSDLKSDEEARLLPGVGWRSGASWIVPMHAWVFEPELDSPVRGAALAALRAALELPPEAESSALFLERARAFFYDNESGKRLVVRIGDERHLLDATGADGHSETELRVAAAAVAPGPGGAVAVRVEPRAGDERRFAGELLLLPDSGLSVISDVDDTIKISEVRDKQKLLANTFLRPFAAVPGMADAYRRWAAQGAAFHYVSASPWQLFDPLRGFLGEAGYPSGSMHMKQFRWKDQSFFSLFLDPVAYKQPILDGLISRYPQRRFVLVGDSGEKDPEVYAAIYRLHPTQVVGIHIRDVTGEGRDAPRYAVAFAGVPAERWTLFTDPAGLAAAP
jgi:hypothetical protein